MGAWRVAFARVAVLRDEVVRSWEVGTSGCRLMIDGLVAVERVDRLGSADWFLLPTSDREVEVWGKREARARMGIERREVEL